MTVVATAVAEDEAGEEDDRDDEHDSGDSGYPGGYLEDAGSPVWRYRYRSGRRGSCGGSPHSGGFRCFTHETNDGRVNSSDGYALLM